jgi:putative SOS response-associated peptidase YedK
MCYEIASATKAKLKYAQHRGKMEDEATALEHDLQKLETDLLPFYHITGFAFPKVLVFKSVSPMQPEAIQWGLMPSWAKSKADAQLIQSKTLNARIETLAEKPAFKSIVANKCIVMIDGFFEHKLVGKNKYPHFISIPSEEPMCIGGLWDSWRNPSNTDEVIESITLITIPANDFMANIHNNAKMGEARMPLLLPKEAQDSWLLDNRLLKTSALIKEAQKLKLKAHTVQKLSGKRAVGNASKALEKHTYPELNLIQKSLFDL